MAEGFGNPDRAVTNADLRIQRTGGLVPVVVANLTRRIVSGEFDGDQGFPNSADLVTQLGVSRTVIREALRVLEVKQLISIHQGRATTVLPSDKWDLLDPVIIEALTQGDLSLGVFTELVYVRAALEAELARDAAERLPSIVQEHPEGNPAELKRLAAAFAELDTAYHAMDGSHSTVARYLDLDRAFHESVMNIAQNRFARRIVQQVFTWARKGGGGIDVRQSDIESSHVDHTAIFGHVREGRTDEAYHAMRDHILLHWAASTREQLKR